MDAERPLRIHLLIQIGRTLEILPIQVHRTLEASHGDGILGGLTLVALLFPESPSDLHDGRFHLRIVSKRNTPARYRKLLLSSR